MSWDEGHNWDEGQLVRLPDVIPLGIGERTEWAGDAELVVEPLGAFLERPLPPAEALVGVTRNGTNLLPRYGWVLPWGREGSGKTSVLVDLLYHAAAGVPWLHYPIGRPLRVVVVVNEGVPGGLQDKLRQKLESWPHDRDAVLDNLAVYASPWGAFTFREPQLVEYVRHYALDFGADYVALDPLHTLGPTGAGAPQDTEAFKNTLRAFGLWADLGVITAHHSNKVGMISGDWARHADTVIRLEKDGKNPATKYTLEKARPADPHELGVPAMLEWEVESLGYTRRELEAGAGAGVSDETLLERVLEYLGEQREAVTLGTLKADVKGDADRVARVVRAAVERGDLVNESTHAQRFRVRVARTGEQPNRREPVRGADDEQTRMDIGGPAPAHPEPARAGSDGPPSDGLAPAPAPVRSTGGGEQVRERGRARTTEPSEEDEWPRPF